MLRWQGEMPGARAVPFQAPEGSVSDSPLCALLAKIGASMNFEDNAVIFGANNKSDHLYKVLTGAVRICRQVGDGRRLDAFYLPCDIFGLEADDLHFSSAEAIGETTLLMIKRSVFLEEATRHFSAVAMLWTLTLDHFHRAEARTRLFGRRTEEERIGVFLQDMAERAARIGNFEIRLPHEDIADHLDTTVEMVSHVITGLKCDAGIAVSAAESAQIAADQRIAA